MSPLIPSVLDHEIEVRDDMNSQARGRLNKVREEEILFRMDISVLKLVLTWSHLHSTTLPSDFRKTSHQLLQSFYERFYGRSYSIRFASFTETSRQQPRYKVRIKFAA